MSSSSVGTGNWALECAKETYTKQTMLLKDLLNSTNSFQINKTITHMCTKYQWTYLAHILKFNLHFKISIMWFLICK